MSRSPLDGDQNKIERLQTWWLQLPLSYRVNTLLYLLGAFALVILLVNLLTGDDDPRQTRVAAGVSATTTTFRGLGATTTRLNAPSPSTTVGGTTTTIQAAGAATPAGGQSTGGGGTSGGSGGGGGSVGGSGTGGGGGSGGGGGGSGGGGGDGGSDTTQPTVQQTTTTTAPCRNSTESRCGTRRWDPEPAENQFPVVQNIMAAPGTPTVGQVVSFTVTVTELDHTLVNACGILSFGDNTSQPQGNCQPRPCDAQFGPWTPPSRSPGSRTFTFQHIYTTPGDFDLRFQLESRDNCWDPYGTALGASTKTGHLTVAAAAAPGT